jgi:hypothetical protein
MLFCALTIPVYVKNEIMNMEVDFSVIIQTGTLNTISSLRR